MFAQIAAHVTLVYPREAPSAAALVERLRTMAPRIRPFRLRLGRLACFGRPEKGVYVQVDDVDGGYASARDRLLRPPWSAWPVVPHVTVVHPRTSARGAELWRDGRHTLDPRQFLVTEVAITAFDGAHWFTVDTFTLQGRAVGPTPAT